MEQHPAFAEKSVRLQVENPDENPAREGEEPRELPGTASSHAHDALLSTMPLRVYRTITGAWRD